MEIFIFVILIIIVFRYSIKISLSSLSLEKIHSRNLLMLNSPKNTFSFLIYLILVSISLAIITFYRSVVFLEEKECKWFILVSSSLTKLIIFLFRIEIPILFISSILNSNCFIRFQSLTTQWVFQ